MNDVIESRRRELVRQQEWVDKNVNHIPTHFNPRKDPTTWSEVKERDKPIKVAWEPH